MLGIRLVLGIFSVPIPMFGISLSFSWLPIYVVGWMYGPIIGFIFGLVSDTLAWVINGSIWFWLFAIQEPIIGFFSGFFSGLFYLCKNKSIKFLMIIQKFFVFSFILFTIFIVIFQFDLIDNNNFSGASTIINKKIFIIVICVAMGVFLVINEVQSIFMYRNYKHKRNIDNYITYLYVSMLIILVIALFSFILGPYSYVEYYKYINNGLNPSKYLQYGAMYYLIPRVLKESIKTPVYIFLVFSIIVAIKYQFNNVINTIKTKW